VTPGSNTQTPAGERTTQAVTADNFVRAETDVYFSDALTRAELGSFYHYRDPMPVDHQTVVRANRDTLYSSALVDLAAAPVTITLPDPGERFMSLMTISQDHYAFTVYAPGTFTFSKDGIGTRYVMVALRTFVDPDDPNDLPAVHALQDAVTISQPAGTGAFEATAWDPVSQKTVREALLVLGSTLPDMRRAFGRKEQVDPVRHLIGAASGWGGNPDQDAMYLNVTPAQNDGDTVYRVEVPAGVPVDGFWSITVYNAEGYIAPNALGVYSLNNYAAQPNPDGTVTIQFGGCDGGTPNCIPTPEGWNYLVRLYRPRPEVVDGTWTFPAPMAIA
jgi:hypothetical protein